MVIKNGRILSDIFEFVNADILVNDDKIEKISSHINGSDIINAENLYVLPGFIDSHFHGAAGHDFMMPSESSYEAISEYAAKNGTTSLIATIEAAPHDEMISAVNFYNEHKNGVTGAKYRGIHLEGPFFSTSKIGAFEPGCFRNPDIDELKSFIEAAKGELKIISLAPETDGAASVIKYAVSKNITVSMGHTDASLEQANEGVKNGITRATHTFNAMSPLNHRAPNAVGCVLTNKNVNCELICDFYHVHPAVCKLLFTVKGSEKIIMITDSVLCAGLPDGEFTDSSGQKYHVKNKQARLENGTICGGTSCLIDGIKNLVSIGIRLEDAVKAASINPAKSARIDDVTGSIKEGKYADIVICDHDLNIKYVFVNGRLVYKMEN